MFKKKAQVIQYFLSSDGLGSSVLGLIYVDLWLHACHNAAASDQHIEESAAPGKLSLKIDLEQKV